MVLYRSGGLEPHAQKSKQCSPRVAKAHGAVQVWRLGTSRAKVEAMQSSGRKGAWCCTGLEAWNLTRKSRSNAVLGSQRRMVLYRSGGLEPHAQKSKQCSPRVAKAHGAVQVWRLGTSRAKVEAMQ